MQSVCHWQRRQCWRCWGAISRLPKPICQIRFRNRRARFLWVFGTVQRAMAPRRIAFVALSFAFVSVSFGLGASASPAASSLPHAGSATVLHTAAPANHARSGTSYDWCDCKKGLASLTIWATSAPGKRIVVHANATGWVQFASPTKTVGWLCKYSFPPPVTQQRDPVDTVPILLFVYPPLATASICSPLTLLRPIALPVQWLSLRLRASFLARSASSHTRKPLAHAPLALLTLSQATVCRASRRRPSPRPRRGGACASRRRARRGPWVRAGGRPRGASSGTRGGRRRTRRASRSLATTTGTPA